MKFLIIIIKRKIKIGIDKIGILCYNKEIIKNYLLIFIKKLKITIDKLGNLCYNVYSKLWESKLI